MGKGRYLKAAERACARKSRFETRAAAEAFVERRYRAYRCVVCGGYHLTSGRGDRPEEPTPPRKEPSGPKLGDLDWSAVLDPKPKPVKEEGRAAEISPRQEESFAEEKKPQTARCAGAPGKDGRVLLVVEGKLVKSLPVDRLLRPLLREGVLVEIDEARRVLKLA